MSETKAKIVTEKSRPGGITETQRIACIVVQNAVAAGILLFYSKNILGAAIRAFLSV